MTSRFFALTVLLALMPLGAQMREKRVVPVAPAQRDSFLRQGKVAILAGVGDYPRGSGLAALQYPPSDVDALAGVLESQGYNVVPLKDNQATRSGIQRAIRNAGDVLDGGQGTLLFFFSGHGFAVANRNYLAPFGADALSLSQTGLAIDEVERLMRDTGVQRRIMWIDACRNTPGKSIGTQRTFAAFQAAAGTRILFSTKAGRLSYESDDLNHGIFTAFLLQGLQGEAAGNDGLITFRDLADYVTDSVRSYTLRRGDVQIPYDAGEAAGDFLVARAASGSAPDRVEAPVVVEQGTLVVTTDAPCTLNVDGEALGRLDANGIKRVAVSVGSHIVIAISTERADAMQRKVVDVRRGEQQALVVELARDVGAARRHDEEARAEAQKRELLGVWTGTEENDARFTDGDRSRYHKKATRQVTITSVPEGYRGEWSEKRVITNLDAAGGFTVDITGTFILRRDGGKVTGTANAAKAVYTNGSTTDFPQAHFDGTLTPAGLAYKIVWRPDSYWTSGTLTKP